MGDRDPARASIGGDNDFFETSQPTPMPQDSQSAYKIVGKFVRLRDITCSQVLLTR